VIYLFFSCSILGRKSSQEDRVLVVPELCTTNLSFCSVFDGTLGHHASEFVSKNIVTFLTNTKEMKELTVFTSSKDSFGLPDAQVLHIAATLMEGSLRQAFLSCDAALCENLKQESRLYTASTAVSALLWKNLLTIAHIGDSRAVILRTFLDAETHSFHPQWLTIAHKPNLKSEHERITKAGGFLSWVGTRPYLRSPTFHEQLKNGEKPQKLNYSRGFGCPDLKNCGFTADPTIHHVEILPTDKYIILGSDGLWDVLTPKHVGHLITIAKENGLNITDFIVKTAIEEMPDASVRDNISVIIISLNTL
jgi:serine/threonine protein phosphatase PrpC